MMKPRTALAVSLIAGCTLALGVQAAPPEGKGPGSNAAHSGQGNKGKPQNASSSKGNQNKGSQTGQTKGSPHDRNRGYDDRGRYYGYFDGHRDNQGRLRDDDVSIKLAYAGITATLAREYALNYGLGDSSALPPGIRKKLARGKPLPPGIAKQMVPGSMLDRLPRHSGYEWRVAGTDLILISVATAVVADILYDVFD